MESGTGRVWALQVSFGALIEMEWVEIRDNTTYSYRAADLRGRLASALQPPFTLVMFGSSRTMNAYKAGEFESSLQERTGRSVVSYNFGIPSAGHIYGYFSLKKLLAEGNHPDMVLLEVTPPFLAEQASTELDWFAGNELRTREFEVALLLLPESSDFRSWYSPEMLAQIDRYLDQLSAEYSVPVIDARDWINDENFADGNHLIVSGAQAFTERFRREELPKRAHQAIARQPQVADRELR